MAKTVRAIPDEDYAQSANVLFHFMTKIEYLEDILQQHSTSQTDGYVQIGSCWRYRTPIDW